MSYNQRDELVYRDFLCEEFYKRLKVLIVWQGFSSQHCTETPFEFYDRIKKNELEKSYSYSHYHQYSKVRDSVSNETNAHMISALNLELRRVDSVLSNISLQKICVRCFHQNLDPRTLSEFLLDRLINSYIEENRGLFVFVAPDLWLPRD